MQKSWFAVTAVAILMAVVAPVHAITFGEPDDVHENVGAIMVEHPEFGLIPFCSGTLIHERVLLTAGHCTDAIQALLDSDEIFDVRVTFQEDPTETELGDFLEVDLDLIITHAGFAGMSAADTHDLGALILKEPVEDITPAVLAPVGLLDDLLADGVLRSGRNRASFTVSGYGGSLEWPPAITDFKDKRQFAVSEFLGLLEPWLIMSQNPAPGRNDAGTCAGDSGGPTFWTQPDESELIVAVTSWGDAPCVATGIAYRVDTQDAHEFCAMVVAIAEE